MKNHLQPEDIKTLCKDDYLYDFVNNIVYICISNCYSPHFHRDSYWIDLLIYGKPRKNVNTKILNSITVKNFIKITNPKTAKILYK